MYIKSFDCMSFFSRFAETCFRGYAVSNYIQLNGLLGSWNKVLIINQFEQTVKNLLKKYHVLMVRKVILTYGLLGFFKISSICD